MNFQKECRSSVWQISPTSSIKLLALIDAFYFIFLCRFKVVDLLTMASQHQNTVLESEHERAMLEGALTFLVILLSLRLHLGKRLIVIPPFALIYNDFCVSAYDHKHLSVKCTLWDGQW